MDTHRKRAVRSVGDELVDAHGVAGAFAGGLGRHAHGQTVRPWRQIRAQHHRARVVQALAEGVQQVHRGERTAIDARIDDAGIGPGNYEGSHRRTLECQGCFGASRGGREHGWCDELVALATGDRFPIWNAEGPPLLHLGLGRIDEAAVAVVQGIQRLRRSGMRLRLRRRRER